MFNAGSYKTHNYSASLSGANEISNYYLGFEKFHTDGMSAMTYNDEKDSTQIIL